MPVDDDDEYAQLFKKLPSSSGSGSSWQDVASELEALGNSVADLLRGAWRTGNGEADLSNLRQSLESVISDMNRAVDGSPETAQARDQMVRLIDSIRGAIDTASAEIRPELVSMLRQANAELRRRTHLDD
jgi:hypothetical protein